LVRPQCNRSGLGDSINRVFPSPSRDDHAQLSKFRTLENDIDTISQASLSGFLIGEFIIHGGILLLSTLCMTYPKMEPLGFEKGLANAKMPINFLFQKVTLKPSGKQLFQLCS
jgi:hypothetical protein